MTSVTKPAALEKSAYEVPYTALGTEAASMKRELVAAFEGVLASGRYILGPEVAAFEKEFAAYCGASYAVGLANGTCSLHLVMRALGLRDGDEIITSPNSFVASASTIALAGARPVFVDIRPDGNIDPDKVEAAISPRTRAIVPVHIAGRAARMDQIMEIARRRSLFVLEDAAQAVGAKLNGKRAGNLGNAACFSLHPLKNLHAYGDGGMMTTNDPTLVDYLSKARNHGLANRDQCDFWSFNCRLDEVQAALLRVQMKRLDSWTEERRRLAFRYNEALRQYVEVPQEGAGEFCVYQTYVIRAERRDELQCHLQANGVEALVHYATPIHLQPAARELGYRVEDFPVTMHHVARILSLPLYPGLAASQQDRVIELIANFYRAR
jgi:dTDP-4-amino-4,6-dideoxygalactose transaminase